MLDLLLAVAHHLCMFGLLGALAVELAIVRSDMDVACVTKVVKVDRLYGALAGAMIIIGFLRATLAAKGWEYYAHNAFFWAKIATFFLVGVLSAIPGYRFVQWRKAGHAPATADIDHVRKLIIAQAALFGLIPVFAAAMARGYGS